MTDEAILRRFQAGEHPTAIVTTLLGDADELTDSQRYIPAITCAYDRLYAVLRARLNACTCVLPAPLPVRPVYD